MSRILSTVLVLSFALLTATALRSSSDSTGVAGLPGSLPPDNAMPSPKATIDLSMAPEKRWKQVTKEVIARHGFDHSFGTLLKVINTNLPYIQPLADFFEATLKKRFPVYYAEMTGLVATLHEMNYTEASHGVSNQSFAVWQWIGETSNINLTSPETGRHMFEAFHNKHEKKKTDDAMGGFQSSGRACSSLITRAEGTGTIIHARNDDGGKQWSANLTVDIDFTMNGVVQSRATAMVGWMGTFTAMVLGQASLTEDQRMLPTGPHKYTIVEYVTMVDANPGAGPVDIIMRQGMIDNGGGSNFGATPPPRNRTYANILNYLQKAPIGQPVFLILAGVESPEGNQGAIISRNITSQMLPNRNHTTLTLGQTSEFVPFDWALVETNYDWWMPLPYPAADPRRSVIVDHFHTVGRQGAATMDGLLKTLSIQSHNNHTNGVLNVGTIFTVIMVPSNGTYQSYLRNSNGCCN